MLWKKRDQCYRTADTFARHLFHRLMKTKWSEQLSLLFPEPEEIAAMPASSHNSHYPQLAHQYQSEAHTHLSGAFYLTPANCSPACLQAAIVFSPQMLSVTGLALSCRKGQPIFPLRCRFSLYTCVAAKAPSCPGTE